MPSCRFCCHPPGHLNSGNAVMTSSSSPPPVQPESVEENRTRSKVAARRCMVSCRPMMYMTIFSVGTKPSNAHPRLDAGPVPVPDPRTRVVRMVPSSVVLMRSIAKRQVVSRGTPRRTASVVWIPMVMVGRTLMGIGPSQTGRIGGPRTTGHGPMVMGMDTRISRAPATPMIAR